MEALRFMPKVAPSNFSQDKSKLDSENIALCTISNDAFACGTQVLIYSFLKNNSWFKGDIVIFTSSKVASLGEQNRKALLSISNKIIFYEIPYASYSSVYDRFIKLFSGKPQIRFLPSFFTYESFELTTKYDRLLYLDSDMVVRADLSDVFMIDSHLPIVTPDAGEFSPNKRFVNFNGGFLYLTSKIEQGIRDKLLNHSLTTNDHGLADQSIMNSFFKGNVLALDSRYNCLKRCFPNSKFNSFDSDIKVVHYVGTKPWHSNKKGREADYSKIEAFWHFEYTELRQKYGL